MSESVETRSLPVNDNGSYTIRIEDIKDNFTPIDLSSGNSVSLLLSPGDSIFVDSNYWMFKESMIFSGRGSDKNNYLIAKSIRFKDSRNQRTSLQRISNPERYYQTYLAHYSEKVRFLEEYPGLDSLDSEFYHYERAQIDFEAIDDLFSHYLRYHSSYTETGIPDFLVSLFEKNSSAVNYFQSDLFRKYISASVDYSIIQENGGRYIMPDPDKQIEWSESNFTGKLRQAYQTNLINGYLRSAGSDLEKVYLLEYFIKNITDRQLTIQLENQIKAIRSSSLKIARSMKSFTTGFLIISLIVVMLVLGLGRLYMYLCSKGRRPIPLKWLRIVLYIAAGALLMVYLTETLSYRGLSAIIYPLIILATFIIHTSLLIPKLALQGHHCRYFLLTGLLLITDILLFLLVNFWGRNFSESHMAYNVLLTQLWIFVLFILSWLHYYLRYLEKHPGSGLKEMIDAGLYSRETAIIVFLALLINILYAGNASSRMAFLPLINTYTIAGIFLILTFSVVPAFLRDGRWLRLLVAIVTILIIQVVITVMAKSVQTIISLRDIGINAGIFETLNFRYGINPADLILSLLLLIPAGFYNYIKKLIVGQETKGFRMFRQKEAELIHLRSQVNPHFLFNSLNSLYAYALREKNEKTAEPIAKLANLMRFMIDDMDKEFIPLAREADYIQDYIRLQLIRSSVEHDITINISLEDEEIMIAPMLLIPLVENAYKHGINPSVKSWLKLDLKGGSGEIQFVIENSINRDNTVFDREKGFGIGLDNVKGRLQYMYPGRHSLSIAETENRYLVILKIVPL
jgi:sensor histidine kinase YesM